MSTVCTIRFEDHRGDGFYVCRGHDGFPDEVISEIKETLDAVQGDWGEPEVGLLVAAFLGRTYVPGRYPDYEPQAAWRGDESYRIYVRWTGKAWEVENVSGLPPSLDPAPVRDELQVILLDTAEDLRRREAHLSATTRGLAQLFDKSIARLRDLAREVQDSQRRTA